MMNNDIKDIRNIIFSGKNIAISAHTSPDGDAIGASSALAMAINETGGKAKVFIEEYSDTFDVIPVNGVVEHNITDFKPDIYVAVDCGDIQRLGDFAEVYNNTPVRINIDHHKSNTYFGMYNYVDAESSSTSEIIYLMIRDLFSKFLNPEDIAACIYSGIVFDTGGFRHTSTGTQTLLFASELIKYNFNFNKIYNTIFNTRKYSEAKAMGKALCNMKNCINGSVVYSYLLEDEIAQCGTTSDGLSEIVNYLKGISGCETAVFVYEKTKGVFKVSMRSEDKVDVSLVAVKFGGGGHAKAAGCTIESENVKTVLNNIICEIEKSLA